MFVRYTTAQRRQSWTCTDENISYQPLASKGYHHRRIQLIALQS
jgi:hypothetical protein